MIKTPQYYWNKINKILGLPKSKIPNLDDTKNIIPLSHKEAFSGKNNLMYGLKGKDHPAHASNNNYRDNPEYKKNLSKAQMGHENYARHYIITTPEGETIKVRNLHKYCREHNLSSGTMTTVAKGGRKHYKDYMVKYA